MTVGIRLHHGNEFTFADHIFEHARIVLKSIKVDDSGSLRLTGLQVRGVEGTCGNSHFYIPPVLGERGERLVTLILARLFMYFRSSSPELGSVHQQFMFLLCECASSIPSKLTRSPLDSLGLQNALSYKTAR